MDITREQFLAHPSIAKLPEPQRQQLAREFFKEVVRPSLKAVPKEQRAGTLANWTGIDTHQVAQVGNPLEAFGRGFARQTTRDGTTATAARVATGGALADKSRQNYTTTGGASDAGEALGRFAADLADPLSFVAGGVAGKLAGKALTTTGAGRAIVGAASRAAGNRAGQKAITQASRQVGEQIAQRAAAPVAKQAGETAAQAAARMAANARPAVAPIARRASVQAAAQAGQEAARLASARAAAQAARGIEAATGAAANAPIAAGASAAHQLDQNGSIDGGQLAQDTLFGALLGGAMPLALSAVRPGAATPKPGAPAPLPADDLDRLLADAARHLTRERVPVMGEGLATREARVVEALNAAKRAKQAAQAQVDAARRAQQAAQAARAEAEAATRARAAAPGLDAVERFDTMNAMQAGRENPPARPVAPAPKPGPSNALAEMEAQARALHEAARTRARANQAPREASATVPRSSGVEATVNPRDLPSRLERVNPAALKTDPEAFQFKAGGDEAGVTERLRGVTDWDGQAAEVSPLVVWEASDGARYVADGHQRTGLARRLVGEGKAVGDMPAVVLREADGWTREAAMLRAARHNVQQGSGSAVDAARLMRNKQFSEQDIAALPPGSALVRDAKGIANLSDPLFKRVAQGELDAGHAGVIGRQTADAAEQDAIAAVLRRNKPGSLAEAEHMARFAKGMGFDRTVEATLFGEQIALDPLVEHGASVLNAAARSVAGEKSAFGNLVRNAERLESVKGNRINADATSAARDAAAQMEAVLTALAHRPGPVRDALREAARSVKAGTKPAEASVAVLDAAEAAAKAAQKAEGKDWFRKLLTEESGQFDAGAMAEGMARIAKSFRKKANEREAAGDEQAAVRLREAEEVARQAMLMFRQRPEPVVEGVKADGHFNFRRSGLSGPEADRMAQRVREVAAERGFDPKQRMTHADLRKEAAQLGIRDKALNLTSASVKRGETLNPAVRLAARERLNELNSKIVKLEQELRAFDPSKPPEARRALEFDRQMLEHDAKALLDVLIPTRTQDGRNLAFHAVIAKNSFDSEYWFARLVRENGEPSETLRSELNAILDRGRAAMADGDEKAARLARIELARKFAEVERLSFGRKITTLRKAGLLTSLKTTTRNLFGNVVNQAMETANDATAAALVDWMLSLATKQRTVHAKDAASSGYALRKQFTQGFQDAAEVFRHGAPLEALAKLEIPMRVNTGSKLADTYANAVFRGLAAQDAFFKAYALNKSLHAQAKRAGIAVEDAMKNEVMMAEAIADAEIMTFTNETGLSRGVAAFKRMGGDGWATAIDLAVPFVKTPAAVADRVLDYALVGSVAKGLTAASRAAFKKSITPQEQRALAQALGRGMIGAPLIWLGMVLAERGVLQGDYDPEKRAFADETGRGYGTLKLGNRWVPIAMISPVGNLLVTGASIYENGLNAVTLGASAVQAVGSQPFLTGVSDAVEAVRRPLEGGARFTSSMAGSFVPSIVNDIAMASDTVRRDTRDDDFGQAVVKGIKARVPGLRQQVPAKLGMFGEALPETGGAGAFLPLGREDRSTGEALREVMASGKAPPTPGERFTIEEGHGGRPSVSVELTPELHRAFKVAVGQRLQNAIERWNDDPRWPASESGRQDVIAKLYAEARKETSREFLTQRTGELAALLLKQNPEQAARYGLTAGRTP